MVNDEIRALIASLVEEEVNRRMLWHRIATSTLLGIVPGAPEREYIDEIELADWLGLSRETIQAWRVDDSGPPYYRAARRAVKYSVPQVRRWLAARENMRA